MDTELARTFLAVAASGNFVAAASRLHVTQSTVSARIHTLETALGARLFQRGRNGAELTPSGKRFLRHAKHLVRTVEQALHDVGLPQGFHDVLTLSGRIALWEGFLPHWVAWMREALASMHALLSRRDRIVLAGFRRDIPQLLAELDIAVLAARIPEGVPQAILQAHAARVPVVATAVGGIAEVAQSGVTAFTVPPDDPHALAQALQRALEDRSQAKAQAERGHAMVRESYSVDVMLNRMADLYRRLAMKQPVEKH